MSKLRSADVGSQWSETVDANSVVPEEAIAEFCVSSVAYYTQARRRTTKGWIAGITFNLSCALLGPAWAASRRLWGLCWSIAVVDALLIVLVTRAAWHPQSELGDEFVWVGGLLFAVARIVWGCAANVFYFRSLSKWRSQRSAPTGLSLSLGVGAFILVTILTSILVYRFATPDVAKFIKEFPTDRKIAHESARAIDIVVRTLTIQFGSFFDAVTVVVRTLLRALKTVFVETPWPVMATIMLLAAWRAGGIKTALFTAAAILYLGLFGFWSKAMDTLSLVAGSVVICLIIGLPIGIWAAKSKRVNSILLPILDLMQTMPSFVYLIPAIAFFSVGRTPAVLATVVFAMPPMIRLTTLGISQVPSGTKESALAFGATPAQLLFKVEIPLALPSLMAGVNQTVMMSLSMVVIAALIGAGGLGFDVLFALQQVDAGKGLLSGLAIVVCAMVVDRIIQSSRARRGTFSTRGAESKE